MRRPAAILFDLDGTLVDSLADIATATNLARAAFGLPPVAQAEVTAQVGNGSDALVRALIPVGSGRHAGALETYLRAYDEHLVDTTRLLPGAEAVIERFRGRALAVVSNKHHAQCERILATLGVRAAFRAVVGGDSTPQRKPHPGPLHHALALCGVAPGDAVMVGDGVNDVLAARAAGVPVIALTGGVTPRAELEALRPDALAEGLHGLLALLD